MFNSLAAPGSIGLGLATRAGGAAAFVGAYDAIPSIVAAYGMRRLRTAYTGSILRIRRSSDSTEQDIGYVANGDLDTAAVASFIGAGSGYIRSWYDQSGNSYTAAQATAGSQPLYVASGQNGRPVGRWDGGNDYLFTPSITANNWTVLVVERPVVAITNKFILGAPGLVYVGTYSTPTKYYLQKLGGANEYTSLTAGATAASEVAILLTGTLSASAITIFQNGIQTATSPSTGNATLGQINIGRHFGGAGYTNSDIAELIICNAALSDANRQAAETAANSYWAVY